MITVLNTLLWVIGGIIALPFITFIAVVLITMIVGLIGAIFS